MKNSNIEWCHHTFNPWIGCTRVSPGCVACYAEALAKRRGWAEWGPGQLRHRTKTWGDPKRWNKIARKAGRRERVFCASLADVFDAEVDPAWRVELFELIRETNQLDWLLLTKRPANVAKMLPENWWAGWDNVWLGTSVEDQKRAEERIPQLLAVPAAVHFLSCEPLLEAVDLRPFLKIKKPRHRIDQVIVGGESGRGARQMKPEWSLNLRDQCLEARTDHFFKQWGRFNAEGKPVGKKKAGRVLDGRTWDEVPYDEERMRRLPLYEKTREDISYTVGGARLYHPDEVVFDFMRAEMVDA